MGISMDACILNTTFDLKEKGKLLLQCFSLTLMNLDVLVGRLLEPRSVVDLVSI